MGRGNTQQRIKTHLPCAYQNFRLLYDVHDQSYVAKGLKLRSKEAFIVQDMYDKI